MTDLAPKPDWAPSVWRDKRGSIYAQFGQDVLRFEATEGGLGKLLKLIPAIEGQPGFVSGRGNIADHVLKKPIKVAKKTERERIIKSMSPERREKLRALIQKAGIKESK
jgi:hypothetical protein